MQYIMKNIVLSTNLLYLLITILGKNIIFLRITESAFDEERIPESIKCPSRASISETRSFKTLEQWIDPSGNKMLFKPRQTHSQDSDMKLSTTSSDKLSTVVYPVVTLQSIAHFIL